MTHITRVALVAMGLLAIASVGRAEDKPATIVMLGDSTTLSQQNAKGKKLTDQVQLALDKALETKGVKAKVVNSGVGGDTAKGGLGRLGAAVLGHKPDVVTISFGLNDVGRSTPEEFEKSLRSMIEKIQKEFKARIILVTSTPFDNKRHAWGQKFADKGGLDEFMDAKFCAAMRTLSKELKVGLCDLHADFAGAIKKDPALFAKVIVADGVHLSDEGNALAAKHLAPRIAEALTGK